MTERRAIDTLATWFVVQGRHYTGGIYDGTEWALLLRLFKGGAWIDVGATTDGSMDASPSCVGSAPDRSRGRV